MSYFKFKMLHGKVKSVLSSATSLVIPVHRNYKNFGHKRQPIPGVTVLWHGFLTFTFIGLGVEWKWVAKFMLGDDSENLQISFDPTDPVQPK